MDAIEGSREATGEKHRVVDADSGFASRDNYERLEKEEREALIPDHRLEAEQSGETSRWQYDRSKFIYDEKADTYICPWGRRLSKKAEVILSRFVISCGFALS